MISRRLQVFVSSTYLDLKDERQAAVQAILSANHIPAGMELFAAQDLSQWEAIKRWIDDSDIHLLILGGRYGSVEQASGKSYTQLEYEYAIEQGKLVFGIVLTEGFVDRKVESMGKDAVERSEGGKYEEFRKVVLSRMCREVDNLDQLQLAVFHAVTNGAADVAKDAGWVRAKDVAPWISVAPKIPSTR